MMDLLSDFSGQLFFQQHPFLSYLWIGIIGLLVGSFLNVVIIRLPVIEELVEASEKNPLPKSLMGRSYCPCCGAKIPWYLNIPVFSWAMLKGRSACCEQRIHWRYPLVEIITGFVSLGLLSYLGFTVTLLVSLLAAWLVIALVAIDLEHQFLPDALTFSLLWLGLLSSLGGVFQSPNDAIMGAAFGYGFLWFIGFIFYLRHKKVGLGNGDMKFLAALASFSGALSVPGIMGIAVVTFGIVALIMLMVGKLEKAGKMCFGPFIALGFITWVIFGPLY